MFIISLLCVSRCKRQCYTLRYILVPSQVCEFFKIMQFLFFRIKVSDCKAMCVIFRLFSRSQPGFQCYISSHISPTRIEGIEKSITQVARVCLHVASLKKGLVVPFIIGDVIRATNTSVSCDICRQEKKMTSR